MLELLVFAAAIASLIAAGLYIRAMIKGQTRPNRVTWLMWSIAPFIATAAEIYSGVTWAVIPVFMTGFAPFLIFCASFFTKAYWKLCRFDYFCGGISALALVLWVVTMEPVLSIILAIAADAIASIPTLKKAYRNPETESVWPFITGIFNAVAALVVAVTWSFTEISFPIYLLAINILLVLVVHRIRPALKFQS
jgi:hypothetical protein